MRVARSLPATLLRVSVSLGRTTRMSVTWVFEVASGDFDVEDVADLDAGELVEHGGVAQAGVAGEDGVRGFAADGQGGAEEVADALVEGGVFGAVVDGQAHVDGGDDGSGP